MLAALTVRPAPAAEPFRQGALSIGVFGSYEILRLQDLNTQIDIYNLDNGTRFDDMNDGLGFYGELRYAFWRKVTLGVEGGYFSGDSKDPVRGGRIVVSGVPVAFTAGWTVHEERKLAVRVLVGLGYIIDGTFRLEGEDSGEANESDFLFEFGGEMEWRPVPALGLVAQGMARQANLQRPTGFVSDLDFSGGTVRFGLRSYWGGRPE